MPNASIISIVRRRCFSSREGLADLVSSMGYQEKTFGRAEHFLSSHWLRNTTCVVADVQMPEMTDWSFTLLLRTRESRCRGF
jgi:FixJ family two-component response regulator